MKKKLAEKKGELTIASVGGDIEEVNSSAKEKLLALIEKYKVSNPAKYELKKEALEKQLSEL